MSMGYGFGFTRARRASSGGGGGSSQTALFGDATNAPFRPYVAGVPVDITGTPTLTSGSAGGYTASVSGGGLYFGAGTGAPDGATYTCTLAAGGSVDITVSVTANAYSVNTISTLRSTITTMRAASQSTDWTLILRGATYGAQVTDYDYLGKDFNGTITDTNSALLPENRDLLALATASGGSVRIKSEVQYAAIMMGRHQMIGSGPFIWDGCDFSNYNNVDCGNSTTIGGLSKNNSTTYYQLEASQDVTYPVVRRNVAQRCKFGVNKGQSSMRFIACVSGIDIVEQCYFDGFTIGVGLIPNGVGRSNIFRNFVTDGIRFAFSQNSDASYYIYGNEIYQRCLDAEWNNEHGDAFQAGTPGMTGNIYAEIHNNYAFHDDNQGMPYFDDSDAHFRGIFQQNFYWGHHANALHLWAADDVLVRNNTYIERADGSARQSSPPSFKTPAGNAGRGPIIVGLDNIVMDMSSIAGDFGLDSGNVILGQTGTAYSAAFDGTFTGGSGAPVLSFADTSDATRKSTILAAFGAKAGGPVAGIGFQYLRTAYPPLADFPAIVGAALSTLTETDPRTILRGTALVITATAGTEYEVRASDDTTVLQAWTSSSGVASKGNKVRCRKTTAGSALTAVTAQITVDGTVFATTITTALASPAVYATTQPPSAGVSFFRDTSSTYSSKTRTLGRIKLRMNSAPVATTAIFGQPTSAWLLNISTARKLTVAAKDSGNVFVRTGTTVVDSLGADVVWPTGVWLDIVFDVNHTAQTITLYCNGVTYPVIPFTTAGTGFMRTTTSINIGASGSGPADNWPSGWDVADIAIELSGAAYKTIGNGAAAANADAWKLGSAFI